MGYDEKLQKRDGGNHHIPQFFDELLNDFRPLLGDEHGTYMQDVQAKAVLDSIYARLGDLTTEQKAEAIRLLLATIDGKVSTAAKQDAAKAVLDAIAGKDYATQTTLAQVLTKLSADPATAAKQDAAKVVLDTLATAAKQDALKTVVDVISTAVAARASEATLAAIRTALTDGSQKVTLSGSIATDGVKLQPRRVTYEVLVNAQSVAAGGHHNVSIDMEGVEEAWLFIMTDTQPWRVRTTVAWNTITPDFAGTYPYLYADQTTIHSADHPKGALLVGTMGEILRTATSGLDSWTEAIESVRPFHFNPKVRYSNRHTTDTATYGLAVMRVWR